MKAGRARQGKAAQLYSGPSGIAEAGTTGGQNYYQGQLNKGNVATNNSSANGLAGQKTGAALTRPPHSGLTDPTYKAPSATDGMSGSDTLQYVKDHPNST